MIDLIQREEETLAELKDFQRATVNRCFEVYKSGQKRILVADEVGLGKTLIAKGVIARTARWHKEDNDNLFKTIYICSNQSIASQNIHRLCDGATFDGVTDARLSMQHLKIFEQENDPEILDRYIQIIPLTPGTSFNITGGSGSVNERALMFALLRRMEYFQHILDEFEAMMIDGAKVSWDNWCKAYYEDRVVKCDQKSGNYISVMMEQLQKHFSEDLIAEISDQCKKIELNRNQYTRGSHKVLYKLRNIFAGISIDYLQPDLVIMDEFQRFRELISANESTEIGMLTSRFLKSGDAKVLLLSATPYKLYQTLDEMSEYGTDEHFSEFLEVMDFLFDNEQKKVEFREVWTDYSRSLREISRDNITILNIQNLKRQAEDSMYGGVCRTERMLIDNQGSILDPGQAKTSLKVTERDVLSYIEADKLIQEVGQAFGVPVDYVKSAPYLLSFMENYQLKKDIKKYFKAHPEKIRLARKQSLWLDKAMLKDYREIPLNNARLRKLRDIAFEKKAQNLLWIPPSKPYYELAGAFLNSEGYSKVLVFSAWEMVPRMIASMLSYEAERLTVGKRYAKEKDKKGKDYFARQRFPLRKLKLNQDGAQPLFALLYPSVTLSKLYNPARSMGQELKEIKRQITRELNRLIQPLSRYVDPSRGSIIDTRWYYIAPMLLDLDEPQIKAFFDQAEPEEKMHREKLREFRSYYENPEDVGLRRMPNDLVEVLTNMTLASPAVCSLRTFGDTELAGRLAKEMINLFNTPEAISAIEMQYGKTSDDAYYKNVLKYAVDGNLQSVLDEYVHMIDDDNPGTIASRIIDAININTANYTADTYFSFKNEIEGNKERKISIRSHFAAGFYNLANDNKTTQRKDSVRNAFNSPFRPFVLATTSIGQEGLDFHYYCRKIVHWNLPSNPIDLEQREGRINRFKSLAIRQNIARKYGSIKFKDKVWDEMFDAALRDKKDKDPELVPFWCLPEGTDIKIERIVPQYPLSKDGTAYERLIKILSLYRLTLGQARQEELLEYLFNNFSEDERDKLKDLFIDLSPFRRQGKIALEG